MMLSTNAVFKKRSSPVYFCLSLCKMECCTQSAPIEAWGSSRTGAVLPLFKLHLQRTRITPGSPWLQAWTG